MNRPRRFDLGYWAPAPCLLKPVVRVIWRYRHHYLYLPTSWVWPPLILGDW